MRTYQTADITVPRDINLTELLHTSADENNPLPPSHIIASDSLSHRSLTLGELRDHAGRLAKGFTTKLHATDGDRWALIVPNSVDLVELVHAVLWTGGTVCPINHALKVADISHGLAIAQPRYIVVYTETLSAVEEAITLAGQELASNNVSWSPPTVVTVVGKRVGSYMHIPNDLLADDALPIPHYGDTSQHIASIHLSSGTTGSPKGIQLTHHNYIANCHQLRAHDSAQWHRHTRIVTFTPWVHIAMTTMPYFFGPWTGMHHHAMPSFDMASYLSIVNSLRPTAFQGAPSIMQALVADPSLRHKFDFSAAEFLVGQGTGITAEMRATYYAMANWQTSNLYGMTEAAPYVAFQKKGTQAAIGSVGPLLPGIRCALKRPGTSEDAPQGGPGELWISGPNVARRYVSITDAEGVNQRAFPMEGWYNTGDVCTITAEGVLAVVGRTKELIKYKGFQVSPVELDGYLNRHPLVVDGAAGSLWDAQQLTELPTGYVVLVDACKGNEAEALRQIQQDVDKLVTGYKKLRGGVWQVSEVPRNLTMKILRPQLKTYATGVSSKEMKAKL
ncbi:hypothetical protein FE257_010263 [Aspergillus nanangensis]|uniref:AMP-dependent synthetase/ligase domain-containing protein n=1 Tax=Aspergillus nanangensis TaxID=2582783 RepID=A0AAD4CJK8_ASPNN|nr:hypothetical protein FE257_010263 [Aspergillus nanangensis]